MGRKPVPPFVGVGMVTRRVIVRSPDVVFVKGIIEAQDGLAQVFAEHGGELTLAAPRARAAALDELVDDLCVEIGMVSLTPRAEPVEREHVQGTAVDHATGLDARSRGRRPEKDTG